MEQITKSVSRHYRINDDWLDKYAADETRYVDIFDIYDNPTSSQYLQDLVAMGVEIDFERERAKVSFWGNGTRINNELKTIKGVYEEDSLLDVDSRTYFGFYNHPERYRRIYAHGTTARGIDILGVGTKIRS